MEKIRWTSTEFWGTSTIRDWKMRRTRKKKWGRVWRELGGGSVKCC